MPQPSEKKSDAIMIIYDVSYEEAMKRATLSKRRGDVENFKKWFAYAIRLPHSPFNPYR
jgi:hypothetical protein